MNTDFWSLVDKSGPVPDHAPHLGKCWVWTGRLNRDGYGRFGERLAHRIAYVELVGPIAPNLTLDHLCRVRSCVRAPDHLEAVTHAENMRRSFVLVTHCPAGHEYTEANTRLNLSNGYPRRTCRACERERARVRDAVRTACECGLTVRRNNLAAHRRTLVHAAAMAS